MADESIELDVVDNVEDFCSKQAKEIEHEFERIGVVLGINWDDQAQVRALAHDALNHVQEEFDAYEVEKKHEGYQLKEKITLFALADMMMHLMARSADRGIHTHGGPAWKAFSKALMQEQGEEILPSKS